MLDWIRDRCRARMVSCPRGARRAAVSISDGQSGAHLWQSVLVDCAHAMCNSAAAATHSPRSPLQHTRHAHRCNTLVTLTTATHSPRSPLQYTCHPHRCNTLATLTAAIHLSRSPLQHTRHAHHCNTLATLTAAIHLPPSPLQHARRLHTARRLPFAHSALATHMHCTRCPHALRSLLTCARSAMNASTSEGTGGQIVV